MALAAYARNVMAPQKLVDVSIVPIVVVSGATPRDANRSAPNTTVVDATGGAYTVTMPSGQFQTLLSANQINSTTEKVSIVSLSSSGGVTTFTAQSSGAAALSAGEEMHLVFLVANQ